MSGISGFGGPMWNRAVTFGKNNENKTSLSKDTSNNSTNGGTGGTTVGSGGLEAEPRKRSLEFEPELIDLSREYLDKQRDKSYRIIG